MRCYLPGDGVFIYLHIDATKKSGQRIVGDVDFAGVSAVAGAITPVPGGVGPMTVAALLQSTLACAKRFVFVSSCSAPPACCLLTCLVLLHARASFSGNAEWTLSPLRLHFQRPVPSDIVIASAQTPKPVTQIAAEVGILPGELDSFVSQAAAAVFVGGVWR